MKALAATLLIGLLLATACGRAGPPVRRVPPAATPAAEPAAEEDDDEENQS